MRKHDRLPDLPNSPGMDHLDSSPTTDRPRPLCHHGRPAHRPAGRRGAGPGWWRATAAISRQERRSSATARRGHRAQEAVPSRIGVPFIINDDVALAMAVAADGVHLGRGIEGVARCACRTGPSAPSSGLPAKNSIELAREAVARRRQLRVLRRLLSVPHQAPCHAARPDILRQSAALGLPRVAIGGITPDNAQPLIDAGADYVAAISACSAPTTFAPRRNDSPASTPHNREACLMLQPRTFPARPAPDARRREFAGTRIQVGRRRTFLHRPRGRRVSVGRRGQSIHRLCRLLGADDRRPQSSRSSRGGRARRQGRSVLRHALRGGSDDGRDDHAADPVDGHGPHGQFGHRGHDVGHPAGPRRHRPQPDREIRGLLPRPRRQLPGQGGLGGTDIRRADLARRAQGQCRPDAHPALQRSRRRDRDVRRARRRYRRPDHRTGRRQHELHPAGWRVTCRACATCAADTARC